MAKRRKNYGKSRKGSSGIPFLDGLIDIAGGMAMNAIADKMEEKHHYRKRGVPNPYRASAVGIATGRLKSTSDVIHLGGFLGAMGSFDDDPYTEPEVRRPSTPWQYDSLGSNITKYNDNRYAWRLNCEDGSAYGIAPTDYEIKADYDNALKIAKGIHKKPDSRISTEHDGETVCVIQEKKDLVVCRVSCISTGKNLYAFAKELSVSVGDRVIISNGESDDAEAIVLSVETISSLEAQNITQRIIRKMFL